MKNIMLLILLIIIGVFSFILEPIDDTIDAIAGATNVTYDIQIDEIAGVSRDDDDDDEDDDHDEDDD